MQFGRLSIGRSRLVWILAPATASMVFAAVPASAASPDAKEPQPPIAAQVEASPALLTTVSGSALASTTVAKYSMENPASLVDSSGFGNNGTTTNITQVTGSTLKGYHFNGGSSVAIVPSASRLNPGSAIMTMTAHIRTTKIPTGASDYDLIRKGLYSTAGGEYKMEIVPVANYTATQAYCWFRGSTTTGILQGGPNMSDGKWHTISCRKTATGIKVIVDGVTYSKTVTVGSISNSAKLYIGSKQGGGDWYNGDMDEVSISVN